MTHVTLTVPREYTNRVVDAVREVGVDNLTWTFGDTTIIEFDTEQPKAITSLGLFALIDCHVQVTPTV